MQKITKEIYDVEKSFSRIEDRLISSMVRNFKRHTVEEENEGARWTQWQALQLKALDEYKKNNKKTFKGDFWRLNNKISTLIAMAREEGNASQEAAILEAIRNGHKAERIKKGTYAEFFRLNDREMDALIKATENDFENAEIAMLRQAEDQYRQIIFDSQVYAASGAGTYAQAIDMATKDFLYRGITCIEYKNGARHTMADYSSMCLRTATKRAYLAGEGEKRKEWGEPLVIMNKRGNPCPLCKPFIGKILIDDVWSGGKKTDGKYMLMSAAVKQGLYHPNCRDSHTTYFEGITTVDTLTKKESEELDENYKEMQREKYKDRMAGKMERLEENSLDKDNKEKYKARKEKWSNVMKATAEEQERIRQRREQRKKEQEETSKATADAQARIRERRKQFSMEQDAKTKKQEVEMSVAKNTYTKAKNIKEAEEYAAKLVKSGSFAIDGEFKNEIYNGFIESLHDVYNMFGRKIDVTGINRVNKGFSSKVQAYQDDRTRRIHIKNSTLKTLQNLATKNFESGFSATANVYGTFYHEIGHSVWLDLPYEAREEITEIYKQARHENYLKWMEAGGSSTRRSQEEYFAKTLSKNALENEKEFFSEAFTQIVEGRTRPVARKVKTVLNKYYKA